jgi:hypothetical protein
VTCDQHSHIRTCQGAASTPLRGKP